MLNNFTNVFIFLLILIAKIKGVFNIDITYDEILNTLNNSVKNIKK